MIIKRTEEAKTFKPIKVSITIESGEEALAISDMCAWNESIPSLMDKPKQKEIVTQFLDSLRHNINYID